MHSSKSLRTVTQSSQFPDRLVVSILREESICHKRVEKIVLFSFRWLFGSYYPRAYTGLLFFAGHVWSKKKPRRELEVSRKISWREIPKAIRGRKLGTK